MTYFSIVMTYQAGMGIAVSFEIPVSLFKYFPVQTFPLLFFSFFYWFGLTAIYNREISPTENISLSIT